MLRVRNVRNVEEFVGVPGDPEGYTASVRGLWDSGASRREWCFVLEDGAGRIGRLGFRVEPTVSDPAWSGSLPPQELFVYGLHLPWEDQYLNAGKHLLGEAIAAVSGEIPEILEIRINNSIQPHPGERTRLLEACGMNLFQEKHGFTWNDRGRVASDGRLLFQSIADIGEEAYRSVMAPCGQGTLDRNDRYYWSGCGPDNWAAQMTDFLDEDDASMWLIGYRDDQPVGYIAVARVEDWGSTIVHVGVLPDHRGNGYIDDLLAAGTNAARDAGIDSMLSDVDVLNEPMRNAMSRAGHVEDPARWHVWVYRTSTSEPAV